MNKQAKQIRNKRIIVAVALVGLIAAIGGVIAYNMDTHSFGNEFNLKTLGTEEFIETFESPANWVCEEPTTLDIKYVNHTDTTRVVRVKYEEYWKAAGSTSTDHTTELPLENNGNRVTTIAFQNTSNWSLQSDGWYYYTTEVPDEGETLKFMESVTLNCDFSEPDPYTCTETANGRTCENTITGYNGATYHVYITMQSEEAGDNDWPYTPAPAANSGD